MDISKLDLLVITIGLGTAVAGKYFGVPTDFLFYGVAGMAVLLFLSSIKKLLLGDMTQSVAGASVIVGALSLTDPVPDVLLWVSLGAIVLVGLKRRLDFIRGAS